MITTKLLSEVLGIPIQKLMLSNETIACNKNEIRYLTHGVNNSHNINIYELAHKCKEWADTKYFLISSVTRRNKQSHATVYSKTHTDYERFTADTEPEAIFKACEWVLTKEPKMNRRKAHMRVDYINHSSETHDLINEIYDNCMPQDKKSDWYKTREAWLEKATPKDTLELEKLLTKYNHDT